jgi:hypothetical protein
MQSGSNGHVDIEGEGFIVRFAHDPTVLAWIKTIQRRRWLSDRRAWLVDRHWPSVQRLLHIAAQLGWTITSRARAAEAAVREASEFLEYSLDVVHDHYGHAWFVCVLGEDDDLRHQVSAIPGAYWEDGWRIPTDWDQCCGPLREIVEDDSRFELSNAAWRLLTEPDVSDLYLRSCVPTEDRPSAAEGGFPDEDELEALADSPLDGVPAKRKPRITSRSTRQVSVPQAADARPLAAANERPRN